MVLSLVATFSLLTFFTMYSGPYSNFLGAAGNGTTSDRLFRGLLGMFLFSAFISGLLLMVPAGEGSHLAVLASDKADVGGVGHNMNELVEQIGAEPGPELGVSDIDTEGRYTGSLKYLLRFR